MKLLGYTFIIVLIFSFSTSTASAKSSPLPTDSSTSVANRLAAIYLVDEGRKAFNQGRFLDALRSFREAYVRDNNSVKAVYWIAEAHYSLNNYGYALSYGKIAQALSKEADGDIAFILARAYHRQNELDSAKIKYERSKELLSKSKIKDYDIEKCLEEVAYAQSLSDKNIQFKKELLNENINSGYNDYCAFITDHDQSLYYVSRRPDTKGGNVNPEDQQYFEDIYFSQWDTLTNDWGPATNDLGRLNTEGFDAISHISADGNTAYMTVNTSILDYGKQTRGSDIFYAEKTREGKWSRPKPIQGKSINTTFFDGAPTLTADENTMYFISDREGEKSKSDIYVVNKVGKKWGTAKKLPMTVNSIGNETTPFITPDGRYLFFSSDGRKGMGGYDIYVTENLGSSWTEPKNLGPEFNTVNDDLFFKYFQNLNKAFLSTYRIQGEKSSIDIFEIDLEGWKIP